MLYGVTARQRLIDEAMAAIDVAKADDAVLSLSHQTKQMAATHPDIEAMEIRRLVALLAVRRFSNVAFD